MSSSLFHSYFFLQCMEDILIEYKREQCFKQETHIMFSVGEMK